MNTAFLTALALIAFAGNSILCRLALGHELIDANSFTLIRLLSGAITLLFLLSLSGTPIKHFKHLITPARFTQAGYLFIYAVFFSYAYVQLDTASGALLLFSSVQFTMLASQFWQGNKPNTQELCGLLLAILGFIYWMLPSSESPSMWGAVLMIIAGMAWAAYTLAGKHVTNAKAATAENFTISVLFCVLLIPIYFFYVPFKATQTGIFYAVMSGSLTSAIGYWIWYSVLPKLTVSSAAVLQLLVPVLAAIAGFFWAKEIITASFIAASIMILTGIYLVIKSTTKKNQ